MTRPRWKRRKDARNLARSKAREGQRDEADAGCIVRDPGVCSGADRFAGTRIPVATVLRVLADGWGDRRILRGYPALRLADIQTARRIAAQGAAVCTGPCGREADDEAVRDFLRHDIPGVR